MAPFSLAKIIPYVLFVAVFVGVSYFAHTHQALIQLFLANGSPLGVCVFTLLTALFVIFLIPLDIVFLIPLGVHIWGPFSVAFMSIAGWVLGATIAFAIGRTWGMPLVARLVGAARIEKLHALVPSEDRLFWTVVFLRMLVPVDLLSYALGIFTRCPWGQYLLATAIGVTPFGFYFAYVGALPWWYQIIALVLALILVTVLLGWYRNSSKFRQK